ncbi:MAG: thioredoxin [Candidatus Aminicenantes bacterium]|nr:MAG: thioredoxin [Candidatus Aminicenantes bacterium]
MAEDIFSVTDENFEEEVLKSDLPVLVDFWAVWCAPCRAIEPTVEHLSQNYKDKLRVVKLNVDEQMKTPSTYGVRGIPTLLLFKEGELKETIVGTLPQDTILEILSKHL